MFYTILPQWPFIKPRFKRIARFAPVIGLFIGLLQSFIWFLLNFAGWSNISASLICLTMNIFITGGLHADGLMDTADGLGAGSSKRYKAMKDSRVGAMGVQSLFIVLILQIAAIITLDNNAPFAFPIAAFWGRFSQIFAIGNYKYFGKGASNSLHKKNWKGTAREIKPSLLLISLGVIVYLLYTNINISNLLLILMLIAIGVSISISIPYFINKCIGGHNGDTYGASLLITETINLLILSIIIVPN